MKKMLIALLLVCGFGCSQSKIDTIQSYTPQVTVLSKIVTEQALVGKPDNVRQIVNSLSGDTYDALSGSLVIDADKIGDIIDQVASKYGASPLTAIAKPIVEAVLLVALQSAQEQINKIAMDAASKNEIVAAYIKAACKGIEEGSVAPGQGPMTDKKDVQGQIKTRRPYLTVVQ